MYGRIVFVSLSVASGGICVLRQIVTNSYHNIGDARYQLRSRESFSFLASRGERRCQAQSTVQSPPVNNLENMCLYFYICYATRQQHVKY